MAAETSLSGLQQAQLNNLTITASQISDSSVFGQSLIVSSAPSDAIVSSDATGSAVEFIEGGISASQTPVTQVETTKGVVITLS